jgi:putative ABC transport system permease protein
MAIRRALGASRARIVRQLLVESAMLAGTGGLAAIGVSWAGLRVMAAAIPPGGLPYWVTLTMDGRVVAVLAAVCLGTVFVFGLAPALQLARTSPHAAMKDTTARASQDRRSARWTWVFLTAQLALTVMLLAKLEFTVDQFVNSQSREPVIDARHILTFGLTLPDHAYGESRRRVAFYDALRERLSGPGRAAAVSVASALPTSGRVHSVAPDGQPLSPSSPLVRTVAIDSHYFETIGLTLVEGRNFADETTADETASLIVNRRFADLFLPGKTPVGQRIRLGSPPGAPPSAGETRTVIGVVPSLREQPTAEPLPAAFVPLTTSALTSAVVLARTAGDAAVLAPIARDEVRRLDPEVPVNALMTLADANWAARWNSRVSAGIITTITMIALALATVGLAALTAFAVAQRRHELGIRLALGASRSGIVRLVLRRVLLQVLVGVAAGAIGAKAWDPSTTFGDLFGAALVAVVVIVGVSAWPAAGAGRIDPLQMLRDQ